MQTDDLVADVASDVVDGDKTQIGIILLMVIGAIISEIIRWFMQRHILPEEGAREFVAYYNNMGPIRRLRWAFKVRSEMHKHPKVGVSSDKVATSLAGRFAKLTVEDVLAMADKH